MYKPRVPRERDFWYNFGMSNSYIQSTISTYNSIADYYEKQAELLVPERDRELFLSYCLPKSRILDVGCAAGRDSIFFSKQGHIPTGVDLSDNLLAIARKKAPNLTFIHGDVRKKLFFDGSFDAIWACAVLLHLRREDIPAVLDNFYRVLVRNGLLCVRVKEGTGEGDVAERVSNNHSRHFTYFTGNELQILVKAAGFRVEKLLRSNEKDMNPKLRDLWWITVIARKI